MKQLIINGQTVGSIWKTEASPKANKPPKHEGIVKNSPCIPGSYSDPTARLALGIVIREQEEQRKHEKQQKNKKKPQKKWHRRS